MHTVKINGGQLKIWHQRSYVELHKKPHICVYDHQGNWAVYYLRGKQSRIRCNIYTSLKDAIKQATQIYNYNQTARRY
jgi:hypothetical protein